ncbi:MAG: hypothetical protein N0C84_00630 [Candidatus Thiodiazotropha taylori]|uniref:Uncharacterized protein n=1 Tax=Candidatus Thiodiazotropha taylori TaxID=2792791 RepID=A0A9E4K839_9GAMM|nr:hypothetical protein [Candidatus Thiodiazotropha taylori]MCW4254950.1 hypothetical protein [Candidatus Thiodiazotropha taylori]
MSTFIKITPDQQEWDMLSEEHMLTDNLKMLNFKGYLALTESLRMTKTKFGTNSSMSNGKIETNFGTHHHTFFDAGNTYVFVGLVAGGEVGFGTSSEFSLDVTDYDMDPKNFRKSSIVLFSKVFYVIVEMLKQTKTKEVRFSGDNANLERMYDKVVKNKYFLDELDKIGYKYRGKLGDDHYFQKK